MSLLDMDSSKGYTDILLEFLEMPHIALPVLEKFSNEFKVNIYEGKGDSERFVYIPPTRKENNVVLVAHADVVGMETDTKTALVVTEKEIRNRDRNAILGADDRAGCAMAYILHKALGHAVVITDGEEHGQIGANYMKNECKEIFDEINNFQFMVEFDRMNAKDFKCYKVGTPEFKKYIKKETKYIDAGESSFTDICTLADKICGVNLSVGYYAQHTFAEKIVIDEWLNTLRVSMEWLKKTDLPKFSR
ncbi:MAG: M28 family peptidase [Candidatus Cloacimonetes bacterium]|nr:M28 family peptidase [Candidatus Cloacimonadota bacterium]